jgi:two-component system, NarL family, response regulator DegU
MIDRQNRVMLVDDHPMFRKGLGIEIASNAGMEVVAEASNGASAISLFGAKCPDLVVLDMNLPDLTGLDVARRLLQIRPEARLIIVTMLRDEDAFQLAMGIGVMGYVLKECAVDEIMDCVRAVAAGERYVSSSLQHLLQRDPAQQQAALSAMARLDSLTTAERRVLRLLADARTSKEIARILGVSPRTIDVHRARIGSKLQLSGSHSLLYFAIAHREQPEHR